MILPSMPKVRKYLRFTLSAIIPLQREEEEGEGWKREEEGKVGGEEEEGRLKRRRAKEMIVTWQRAVRERKDLHIVG